MKTTRGRAGLRAAVLALGLLAGGASGALADPILNPHPNVQYSTSGQIDSTGVNGTPVISFNSILNNSYNTPSSFSLGAFQVAPLIEGQSTTYTGTPFHISYLVKSVDGTPPNPNETPIQLSGVLNGTVTGKDQSSVVAKFDPIDNPASSVGNTPNQPPPANTFLTGSYKNTLSIFDSPLSLVPSTTNNGQTTAQAYLDVTPGTTVPNPPSGTPEPTSVALFLTALGGLGLRHRLRGRKAS